jgi:hypothetical protein
MCKIVNLKLYPYGVHIVRVRLLHRMGKIVIVLVRRTHCMGKIVILYRYGVHIVRVRLLHCMGKIVTLLQCKRGVNQMWILKNSKEILQKQI